MAGRVIRYGFLFAVLAVAGCEEVIEFRGDKIDPKIVLYTLLEPDNIITVSLAKSQSIFEKEYEPPQITNATVRVFRDGVLLTTLTYVPPGATPDWMPQVPHSKYISEGVRPEPGHLYRIEAEVPGLKPVHAEVWLPVAVVAERVDTMTRTDMEGYPYLQARVRFTDPPGQENYYRLSVRRIEGFALKSDDSSVMPDSVMVYSDDFTFSSVDEPLINPASDEDLFGDNVSNRYSIFSDELIEGKTYDLSFRLYSAKKDTANYEFIHFVFELQSITKDLYLFLRSSAAHYQTRNSPFSEPVIVYSNIVNGLGIAGGKTSSSITHRYGSYPVEGVKYVVSEWYYY